jgi:T5SS/PEP-CTERM-associated repeat protein/autotransporter-associated beta strand protein
MARTTMRIAVLLLTGVAAFFCAPAAQGQSFWTGDTDGNWSTSTNWSPASVPNGNGAAAIFDPYNLTGANVSTITLDIPVTLGSLNFENEDFATNPNFTLGGDNLTFDNNGDGAVLNVTSAYSGTVEIDANITVADSLGLSIVNDGTGSLILRVNGNPGSQLDLGSGPLIVSDGLTTIAKSIVGSGDLLVNYEHIGLPPMLTLTGASTYTGNTTVDVGTLMVNGAEAAIFNTNQVTVGNSQFSMGNLTISNGGFVRNGEGFVGFQNSSNGTVLVTGANSNWNLLGALYVGDSGTGNLTICNGGTVTSSGGYLGNQTASNGTVLVTGASSTWNLTAFAPLYVGNSGTGNLTIANGGTVTVAPGDGVILGLASGSSGAVTVEGANSTWNLGLNSFDIVNVGGNGVGNLTISDNGTVILGTLELAYDSGSVGVVNLESAGTLEVGGNNGIAAVHPANATLNWGGGVIEVTGSDLTTSVNATLVSATISTIDTNGLNATWSGVLSGNGSLDKTGLGTATLTANNTYTGGTTVEEGTLSFSGNLAQLSGTTLTGGPWAVDANATLNFPEGSNIATNNGTIILNGPNASFEAAGNLTDNNGDFELHSGQVFNVTASADFYNEGSVVVDGANSTWNITGTLYNGYNGTGTLTISNGGSVTSASNFVGYNAGSNGTVTVTGANSTWNLESSGLVVGNAGTGNVTIANGGSVTSGEGFLGYASGSSGTVTVDGANSTWNLGSYQLNVGYGGPGNLTISAGGNVTSATGYVGQFSNGTVLVTGANSTWNLGSYGLNVGYGVSSTGNLTISDNGTVALGTLKLTLDSGSAGVVNLESNGTLEVGGTNGIAAGSGTAMFNWGGGVIEVTGSDLTTSVAMTLVSNTTSMINTNGFNATFSGELSGNGALDKIGVGTFTLNGTNTYAGGTTVSAGTLVITSFSSAGTGNVSVADGANLTLETNAAMASTTSLILVDGAQVELNFSGTDTISILYLDGIFQALGTWGGTGSGAQNIDPALFSGPGVLDVTGGFWPHPRRPGLAGGAASASLS